MTIRQYFHLFRVFEDYSKSYLSFSITPPFSLPENYSLTEKEVRNILSENDRLINALYNRNEILISEILSNHLPPYKVFNYPQISEEDAKFMNKNYENVKKGTPLPIQARYVLCAWNSLRSANMNKIKELKLIFENEAFEGSFYPQVTKAALSFESEDFIHNIHKALECASRDDNLYLIVKLLSYYYRINNEKELQNLCDNLLTIFRENNYIDNSLLEKIIKV